MDKRIVALAMLFISAFCLMPSLTFARWYNPETSQFASVDPVFDFPDNFGNGYGYVGGNPTSAIDPEGLNAYVAYRKLNISLLGLDRTFPVSGHVYLAFDDKNMKTAWRSAASRYGFKKDVALAAQHRQNMLRNVPEYDAWLTFSYHPRSVVDGKGVGDLAGTIYTDSWVIVHDDYKTDIPLLESGESKRYLITQDEAQQIRLLEKVMYYQQRQRTNVYENYSFARSNCATWAQHVTVIDAKLQWPADAAHLNVGTGIGGGADYTGLPLATYYGAVSVYHTYNGGSKVVVFVGETGVQTAIVTANGVKWIGHQSYSGAKYVGQKTWNGVVTVGDAVGDAISGMSGVVTNLF